MANQTSRNDEEQQMQNHPPMLLGDALELDLIKFIMEQSPQRLLGGVEHRQGWHYSVISDYVIDRTSVSRESGQPFITLINKCVAELWSTIGSARQVGADHPASRCLQRQHVTLMDYLNENYVNWYADVQEFISNTYDSRAIEQAINTKQVIGSEHIQWDVQPIGIKYDRMLIGRWYIILGGEYDQCYAVAGVTNSGIVLHVVGGPRRPGEMLDADEISSRASEWRFLPVAVTISVTTAQ